ncbi:hypothetical protein M514_17188 [Trichuris suis]|uniref:Uncharacterized protein n=1 Tax=Trichuris suis TaxID=68888 RepID=A0A085NMM0_9BILA|nr:hypothetical protein M514_17188 [Trichuris suis]
MTIRLCFALALLPCCLCLGFLYAGIYSPFRPPVAPGFVPYPGPCIPGAIGCPAGGALFKF